jgi:UDP-glucose 4-epimerase
MHILVTGGAGYIGSHTCVELLNAGHQVTIYDNFCNSSAVAISRIENITGKSVNFVQGDMRDHVLLTNTLANNTFDGVIHFAGLKAVGESVASPLTYYDNNVTGTIYLLQAMQTCNVKTLIFSSSATVYGVPQFLPYTESHPLSATSPYGRCKIMVEDILRDFHIANPDWKIGILRYFNPVGAHESGLIGEDPLGTPNNLMPFVTQVAIGKRPQLQIWGNDYPTPDGTGVRDYIHVSDLAEGHLAALEHLDKPQCFTVNLGTGRGYSVLEIVHAFEQASGKHIPVTFAPRRAGDIASYYADPAMAKQLLNWHAHRTLADMCTDSWRWQSSNPDGYLTEI